MEMYSMTQGRDAMPTNLVAEGGPRGVEIGLEEPMWQLGIGGGSDSYPQRPDEPDCIYYLRTGFCGFDNRCRFNHPRDCHAAKGALGASGGEYPERIDQPVCQYYMRSGICKFGASCKYHHPKHGVGSSTPTSFNVYGFPLRPGEQECSYYIKTRQCKFGATCKFHHPQPVGVQVLAHTLTVGPGLMADPPAMLTLALYPHMPRSYGPMILPLGVVPFPGWATYPVGVEAVY